MKIILTSQVSGLGMAGDIVEVKDGYARNFLVPRRLATAWTKGGQKQVDAIVKARAAREIKGFDDARAAKADLESRAFTVPAKAGRSGRLFGAVSNDVLAAAVKAAGGPDLDKRTIEMQGHVKATGSYEALVRLHPEVQARIAFEVVPA